jgi:hypothetical protein
VNARENPFRTERLEALAFRFLDGDWEALWARLDRLGRRGALVGPCGSGKTTLLHELARRFPARGLRPRLVSAPAERRATRAFLDGLADVDAGTALLVDGAERLSLLAWRRLRAIGGQAGAFVVTRHRPGGPPTLLRMRTTFALLEDLVRELAGPGSPQDLPALFARSQGDLRRALLALYDRWAQPSLPRSL